VGLKSIWTVLALLGIGFLIFALHEIFKYTRMIARIFMGLVYRPSALSETVSRGERISILDSSGRERSALFIESPKSDRMVIFCHESGAGMETWEQYAYFIPSLGFHLLSLDLDVLAKEDMNTLGQWPLVEEIRPIRTAIRWAKTYSKDMRIALFGVSKGADLALAASTHDPSVRAVVADGLFSIKEIFRNYIRRWAPVLVRPNFFGENCPGFLVNAFAHMGYRECERRAKKRFIDTEKLLKKKHPPLLMIHGEEDDYIPVSHQRYLNRLPQTRKNFEHVTVPKAGHNQAIVLSRNLYERKVGEFLRKTL